MQLFLSIVCAIQILYYPNVLSQEHIPQWENCSSSELQPSCSRQIYCTSEFMHDVQLSGIYPDSKTFVDKKLKYSEKEILDKYNAWKKVNNNQVPSKPDLTKFIDDNLEDGDELEMWVPPDFTDSPSILNRISNPKYKKWAYELNNIWKTLARKIKHDVKKNPKRYSLIWVPNGFIIPGGRFRELYYWDTYWIVNGLLLCDMHSTARGIIDNIILLVKQYGFMPNGGRVYYLNRSQPPMLILMVLSYYKTTNDFDYIKKNILELEKEFQFWMKNRMVTFQKDGKTYKLAKYCAPSWGPRPESYREDYVVAERYNTTEERNDFYTRIKSAAETGWDFSSRWFITSNGSDYGELADVQTPYIVPVDLNSLLQVNAMTLSSWFKKMRNSVKANKYKAIGQRFLKNIQEVMWRADKGTWFDWDLINGQHREYFYVSNMVPLWTGSYDMPKTEVSNLVLEYLKNQRIIGPHLNVHFNGTPTSLHDSPQQWDFPNAWPPLQAFIIQGLDRTQHKPAQLMAERLAKIWLRSNYQGFKDKLLMFEKYDVLVVGKTGAGGEYFSQTGFGWTNGVVFELLNQYGGNSSDTNELNRTSGSKKKTLK